MGKVNVLGKVPGGLHKSGEEEEGVSRA